MLPKPALPLALLVFALGPGADPVGQAAEPGSWDVTKPRGRTRKIDFSTDEGTRMSVDVSPDGRWLVFDLIAQGLADIIAEGGYGAIGSHGQQHGIASHWEAWMAASAIRHHLEGRERAIGRVPDLRTVGHHLSQALDGFARDAFTRRENRDAGRVRRDEFGRYPADRFIGWNRQMRRKKRVAR